MISSLVDNIPVSYDKSEVLEEEGEEEVEEEEEGSTRELSADTKCLL